MGGPMVMIFGVFSDTYVRLLKSITSRVFFQDIAKVITIYMSKAAYNSMALNKETDCVGTSKLYVSNTTL